MSRLPRYTAAGLYHHVINRGACGNDIFLNDEDREFFLWLLNEIFERFKIETHAYCLMGNHVHLVLKCPEGTLSAGLHLLNGWYAQTFNKRHKRNGALFRGRFASIHIKKDQYLKEVVRYVNRNPVKHGFVTSLDAYPWSSHKAYEGKAPVPKWLNRQMILQMLASSNEDYQTYINEPCDDFGEELEIDEESPQVSIEVIERAFFKPTQATGEASLADEIELQKHERSFLFVLAKNEAGLTDEQIACRYNVASGNAVRVARHRMETRIQNDVKVRQKFETLLVRILKNV